MPEIQSINNPKSQILSSNGFVESLMSKNLASQESDCLDTVIVNCDSCLNEMEVETMSCQNQDCKFFNETDGNTKRTLYIEDCLKSGDIEEREGNYYLQCKECHKFKIEFDTKDEECPKCSSRNWLAKRFKRVGRRIK